MVALFVIASTSLSMARIRELEMITARKNRSNQGLSKVKLITLIRNGFVTDRQNSDTVA